MRWCTTAPDNIFDVCPEPSGRGIGMSGVPDSTTGHALEQNMLGRIVQSVTELVAELDEWAATPPPGP